MRRDGGGREKEEKGVWSVGERGQSGDESTSQASLQSLAASSVSEQPVNSWMTKFTRSQIKRNRKVLVCFMNGQEE